jgi:sterol desaturase/sphingolipid hydroxylase (fatty acid hydroxylase superfamily)
MLDLMYMKTILLQYSFWLIVCFGLFSLLALLFPNIKGQRIVRPNIGVDIAYWFFTPLFYIQIGQWMLVGLAFLYFQNLIDSKRFIIEGLGIFTHLPLLAQCIFLLLLMNIIQYWTHRLFHGRVLWRFHIIHHAPKELDWLSGVHMHPINMLMHSVLAGMIAAIMGFSSVVYVIMFPIDLLYAAMVHANLNWTFGPLRYIIASPVFHRFHHTGIKEGGERNFAPMFSFLDVLFGTFYMPTNTLPSEFGVNENVPETLTGQLLYPFLRQKK